MIIPGSRETEDSSDFIMNEPSDIYRRKYFMLAQRCDQIQKDNERIVHRVQVVRKMLKRRRKDRKLLKARLDQYGDGWRTAPQPKIELEPEIPETQETKPLIPTKVPSSPVEKGKKPSQPSKRKSKSEKEPRDPNAPKRPANPFLQFCQEQRLLVTEKVSGEKQEDINKLELTRLLANRWKTLSTENKKVYYDKYEKQKERYAVDMQLYALKSAATNSSKE